MTRLQDRDYPILVELYLNCLLSQAKNKKTKGWGELRQSKDQGQGGGVTRSLNQRDRRPVVNTSSLHSAKTRAKTKQEKHHKNKTQKHRVTTDMCGITNSSTCFFFSKHNDGMCNSSALHQAALHRAIRKNFTAKTFRHFLPSWEHHHSKRITSEQRFHFQSGMSGQGLSHLITPAINTKKGLRQRRW